jgi:hypothetical protein
MAAAIGHHAAPHNTLQEILQQPLLWPITLEGVRAASESQPRRCHQPRGAGCADSSGLFFRAGAATRTRKMRVKLLAGFEREFIHLRNGGRP